MFLVAYNSTNTMELLIYLFIYLFIYSFIHSFISSFICTGVIHKLGIWPSWSGAILTCSEHTTVHLCMKHENWSATTGWGLDSSHWADHARIVRNKNKMQSYHIHGKPTGIVSDGYMIVHLQPDILHALQVNWSSQLQVQ